GQSNPKQWWQLAKPIRDELMRDGLSKTCATQIVIGWANPKQWWQEAKPIRDELEKDGLSKAFATQIVIKQSNPKQWWQEAEPIRDELEKDGLSKAFATQIVIGWANPKQWWQLAEPIRDELVRDGLSKTFATQIVIKQANPKQWWQIVKSIIDKIIVLNPSLSKSELLFIFINTAPENLSGKVFGIKNSQLIVILKPLQELKRQKTASSPLRQKRSASSPVRAPPWGTSPVGSSSPLISRRLKIIKKSKYKLGQNGGRLSAIEQDYWNWLGEELSQKYFLDKEAESVSNALVS
ncbi:unnamed protein product, partial [marine sediment metagenome]